MTFTPKKCPFCGAPANQKSIDHQGIRGIGIKHYIQCITCGASGPEKDTPEEAIRAWSQRKEV